jgi:hypothetical protein
MIREDTTVQDEQGEHEPIKDRILRASTKAKEATEIERLVWEELPEKTRIQLGKTRLRQLIAVELKDPDQLEIAFDGERFAVETVPPDVLERRARHLISVGQSLIRRGEAYLREAARRREG